MTTPSTPDRGTGILLLVSPVLFFLHEIEEYLTAIPWATSHRQLVPQFLRDHLPRSPAMFLEVGILVMLVFLALGFLCTRSRPRTWPFVVLGTLVLARLENALVHVGQALLFRGYTPGLITSVVVLLPVATAVLLRLARGGFVTKSSLPWMAAAGVLVQGLVLGGIYLLYHQ